MSGSESYHLPKSSITRFDFEDERYIAGQIVSNVQSSDISQPFDYEAVFTPEQPYQEQMKLIVDPTGQGNQEVISGIVVAYGGVFEGDASNISIEGNGLSEDDKQFIRGRISLSHQQGNKDILSVNAKDIGLRQPNGLQFFDIRIPYIEQEIQYVPSIQQVDMLRLVHSGGPLTTLTLSVTGTPPVVTIDGGNLSQIVTAMRLKDISGVSSGITTNVTIPVSLETIDFHIEYDLQNQIGLRILDEYPIYAYLPGNFSTYVYTRCTSVVSVVGSSKSVTVQAYRSVVGEDTSVFEIECVPGAWDSLTIKVDVVSTTERKMTLEGTMSTDTFDVLSFGGINSSYEFKIEQFSTSALISVRNATLTDSVTVSHNSGNNEIQKVINHNWAATFGSTFALGIDTSFRNLSVELLVETGGWISCGSLANPVWSQITLDGETRSLFYNLPYEQGENNTLGYLIELLIDGGNIFQPPWDGWGLSITQTCGSDWLNVNNAFLEPFGLTQIEDGTPFPVSMGEEIFLASVSTSISASSTTTIEDLSETLQNSLSSFNDVFISFSSDPLYDYLSPFYLKNGSYTSSQNPGSVLSYPLLGNANNDISFDLNEDFDLADLRDQINDEPILNVAVVAEILNGHGSLFQTSLLPFASQQITSIGIDLQADSSSAVFFTYSTTVFTSTNSLAVEINNDLGSYGVIATSLGSFNTQDLNGLFPAVNLYNLTKTLRGTTLFDPQPEPPSYDLVVRCNVRYAMGGNPSDEKGIQVAFGGYESEGVFYPNLTPNAFFEPIHNTIFPIEFLVTDADVVYILIRTRQDVNGLSFTVDESDYDGISTYNNGSPSQSLIGYKPTESQFTSVWMEDFGMPAVLSVPMKSSTVNVMVQDVEIVDSLTLSIKNAPSEIDQFGFLGINRINLSNSQTESKDGRSYGLVLDNRGAWDILIAPEGILTKRTDGQFSHMNSFYLHENIDAEESWDFEFINESSIPVAVKSSISLIPVPNFPKVWIFRIEPGVKEYLRDLREDATQGSNQGCSLYVDILVTGRETGIQGTCRVYIFYDYSCAYEIELCDFFWNMVNPPEPLKPEIIDGNLGFVYESLVDCSLIDFDGASTDVTEIDIPVLVTVKNVPTFENGNALLLMKGNYSAEIRGYFFPTGQQLDELQFSNCDPLGQSLPLALRINRENLWLPGGEVITDLNEIRRRIQTEKSYMWLRPAFQFPPDDISKECSDNETVIVGIGYQFKNWISGSREDKFIFGINLELPVGIISTPEVLMCYKYYYNQTEG